VRCQLANVATGSGSADFEHAADLPLAARRRRRYRFDNQGFFPVFFLSNDTVIAGRVLSAKLA
jgi:hypothetical protein